ncbi:MAG: metallophosphoesterase [Phycisphaerae bacterium]|nr:metallophosphoesterase [Tepidisphaeraceae bacterium]
MRSWNWVAAIAVLLVGCQRSTDRNCPTLYLPANANAATSSAEVSVVAMGDTDDTPDKQWVGRAMAEYVRSQSRRPDAALMLGDNFYTMLTDGTKDPKWQTLFEDAYDPAILAFPFYAILGNHDYIDKNDDIELAYAAENPKSRWKMPNRWYRVDLPARAARPLVTFLMLDSNESDLSDEQWAEQKRWLTAELERTPKDTWVVACGHHPLYSNGVHGDDEKLIREWGELFERGRVDFYLCGHDHTLQHLDVPGRRATFLVAGGGGAGTHVMLREGRAQLARSAHGFVHLRFTGESATGRFVDSGGHVIHELQREHAGAVRVVKAGGTDPLYRGRLIGTTPVP